MPRSCRENQKALLTQGTPQNNNRVKASKSTLPSSLPTAQKRRFQEYNFVADSLSTGDQQCSKKALIQLNPYSTTRPTSVRCSDSEKSSPARVTHSSSLNSDLSGACYSPPNDGRLNKERNLRLRLNRSTIENHSPTSFPTMGHASSKRSRAEEYPMTNQSAGRSNRRSQDDYKDYMAGRIPSKNMRRSEAEANEEADKNRMKGGPKLSSDYTPISRAVGNNQPRFLHASAIKLHKLNFGIDKQLTTVDEKSNAVLKYRTPHFRALATVEIPPLPAGVNIQVGWIQVCTDMQFINTYGNEGLTSWEFPEIVSGKYKMVSDADGKQYPWYGSKNEVVHMQGPTQAPTTATIHMNDNFFPQVTWYIPSIGYSRDPSLTFVYRKQRFYSYLALKDVNTDTYQIIRTLTWSMELAIDVNPKSPLGKRAKLLGPFEQDSPKVVPEHLTPPLKSYALNPPNANSCQVLVWRPKYGDTELVVPPVQTTMDMSRYLISTRDATSKLLKISKSNFLLYQNK